MIVSMVPKQELGQTHRNTQTHIYTRGFVELLRKQKLENKKLKFCMKSHTYGKCFLMKVLTENLILERHYSKSFYCYLWKTISRSVRNHFGTFINKKRE